MKGGFHVITSIPCRQQPTLTATKREHGLVGLAKAPRTVISGRNVEAPLRRIHGLSYKVELGLAHQLYRRADAYVAISHPVAAEAAGVYNLDPDRVWVVPNPATGKDPGHAAAARLAAGPTDGTSVTLTIPARLVRSGVTRPSSVLAQTVVIFRT